MQVGVHAGLQHRHPPQALELGGVGVVVEGAGDEHVETAVGGLPRRLHQVGTRHRAELRPDEHRSPPLGTGWRVLVILRLAQDGRRGALDVPAVGADEPARPRRQRREADAVLPVGLLHAGAPQVIQDDLAEVVARAVAVAGLGDAVDHVAVLVHAQHPVGRDALHGVKGPATRTLLRSS